VRWRASTVVASGARTLVARAWDADGKGQPETLAEVWNVKGYANNAWHRVPIEVTG
jgi:sulfite oxidase